MSTDLIRRAAQAVGRRSGQSSAGSWSEITASPLLDDSLRQAAFDFLADARTARPLKVPVSWWRSDRASWSGTTTEVTLVELADHLSTMSGTIRPKGTGPVFSITRNSDGHRCGESTTAVAALVLDCDGAGGPEALQEALDALHIEHVVYESGGHSSAVPKWRVIIPLAAPYEPQGREGRERWRAAYAVARAVFGAVARLSGKGFDPATDDVGRIWYPGTRRRPEDAPRLVRYHPGFGLDLRPFLEAVPAAPARLHSTVVRVPSPRVVPIASGAVTLEAANALSAFRSAGMLGRDLGGKFAVRCPWNHQHTAALPPDAEPTSATVLFVDGDRPRFFCSHRCGGRPLHEVFAAIPGGPVRRVQTPQAASRDTWTLPRLPGLPGLPRLPSM